MPCVDLCALPVALTRRVATQFSGCDDTWQALREELDFHTSRLQTEGTKVGSHMGVPPCPPGRGAPLLQSRMRHKSLLAQPQPKAESPSPRKPKEAPWRPQNASEWMRSMQPGTRLYTERSAAVADDWLRLSEGEAILDLLQSSPSGKSISHSVPPQESQSFPSAALIERVELIRAYDQNHVGLNG